MAITSMQNKEFYIHVLPIKDAVANFVVTIQEEFRLCHALADVNAQSVTQLPYSGGDAFRCLAGGGVQGVPYLHYLAPIGFYQLSFPVAVAALVVVTRRPMPPYCTFTYATSTAN